MAITALGYLELRASQLDDWAGFGPRLLGLMLAEKSATEIAFRMDDRRQRVIISADAHDGLGAFGWEVADAAALQAILLLGRLPAWIRFGAGVVLLWLEGLSVRVQALRLLVMPVAVAASWG